HRWLLPDSSIQILNLGCSILAIQSHYSIGLYCSAHYLVTLKFAKVLHIDPRRLSESKYSTFLYE
ncbi:MAG: hypothetical protein RLP12_06240, partial [Ekhidna sp.]